MSFVKLIEPKVIADGRGKLVALEPGDNVPFEIKRVYYLYGTEPEASRGFHAHKELKQVAVCVSGKCKMVLDDGGHRESVWLDSPAKGLLIESMIWREIHEFSPNCVLLVLASEEYNEEDYIRDYEIFQGSNK